MNTDPPILLNSQASPRNRPQITMSTAFATPLGHLVRPEHMLNPKLGFSEQQQQHYLRGCSGLWEIIRTNPEESVLFQKAYRKLVALTIFLMARMKAAQAASRRVAPSPENPIQTLIQQTSGARPIPSWSDFEAGISPFHERAQSSTSDESLFEISFGSFDAKDKLTEENVSVALTFLGCDVKSTTADEIQAVWVLLDVQGGTRGELEEYLHSASRRG